MYYVSNAHNSLRRWYYPELTNYENEGQRGQRGGAAWNGQVLLLPETPTLPTFLISHDGCVTHTHGLVGHLPSCLHVCNHEFHLHLCTQTLRAAQLAPRGRNPTDTSQGQSSFHPHLPVPPFPGQPPPCTPTSLSQKPQMTRVFLGSLSTGKQSRLRDLVSRIIFQTNSFCPSTPASNQTPGPSHRALQSTGCSVGWMHLILQHRCSGGCFLKYS